MGMPNSSPRAARTAGAGCTTTCLLGSASSIPHLFGVDPFRWSAPVGQAAIHCPQLMQATSCQRLLQRPDSMAVSKPRFIGPMTPTAWVLSQAATQRRQRMHLLLSRTMDRDRVIHIVLVHGACKAVPILNAQIQAELLQLAVLVAHAGQALLVVIGKQQLQVDLAGLHGRAGVLVFTSIPLLTGQHAGGLQGARAPYPPRTGGKRRFALISFR